SDRSGVFMRRFSWGRHGFRLQRTLPPVQTENRRAVRMSLAPLQRACRPQEYRPCGGNGVLVRPPSPHGTRRVTTTRSGVVTNSDGSSRNPERLRPLTWGNTKREAVRRRGAAMLEVTELIRIPDDEFEWSFARSGGPGGQNVNKVASKAILRWKAAATV